MSQAQALAQTQAQTQAQAQAQAQAGQIRECSAPRPNHRRSNRVCG